MLRGRPSTRKRAPWTAGVPQTQEQFCGRPPWMAGVPQMQEQFAARRAAQRILLACRDDGRAYP